MAPVKFCAVGNWYWQGPGAKTLTFFRVPMAARACCCSCYGAHCQCFAQASKNTNKQEASYRKDSLEGLECSIWGIGVTGGIARDVVDERVEQSGFKQLIECYQLQGRYAAIAKSLWRWSVGEKPTSGLRNLQTLLFVWLRKSICTWDTSTGN
jgi:hypothetical protein